MYIGFIAVSCCFAVENRKDSFMLCWISNKIHSDITTVPSKEFIWGVYCAGLCLQMSHACPWPLLSALRQDYSVL